MKICVLVKEVPDAAVEKRINSATGRLDRSGEKNLNPFDTHAIEAAMQLKEGGQVEVDEVVAVTMGPDSAERALRKAISLGADRSVQLTDPTGSAHRRPLGDEPPPFLTREIARAHLGRKVAGRDRVDPDALRRPADA